MVQSIAGIDAGRRTVPYSTAQFLKKNEKDLNVLRMFTAEIPLI